MSTLKQLKKIVYKMPIFNDVVYGKHSEKPKEKIFNDIIFGKHSEKPKELKEELTYDQIQKEHEKLSKQYKYSKGEEMAIRNYTTSSYAINSHHARYGIDRSYTPDERTVNRINDETAPLDSALNKHRTKKDFALYSGIRKDLSRHIKKGETFRATNFTSSSLSRVKAKSFAGMDKDSNYTSARHMIVIHHPKGSPGGYVDGKSDHLEDDNEFQKGNLSSTPTEREFIHPRNSLFKYTHSIHNDKDGVIEHHVTYMGQHKDD
jgi:hypothetical protein